MYGGLQLIGSLDDVFARAQQQTGALHGRLNELSGRLLQVQKEEGEAYRTLAGIRLGLAEKDPLIMVLEQVNVNVRAARQRRDDVFAEVDLFPRVRVFEKRALDR
ncbi:MAG TPA: hypothetical protein PK694_07150, partial [Rhodospirillales bacterium]|nr:hypothetical protein [Rhodospirillales bacterium]